MLQFYCHVEHLLEAENNSWFTGPGGGDLVVWNVGAQVGAQDVE